MFLAGDEFLNTQFGNNNAYCQDNITSWLDWNLLEKNRDMFEFFRYMIRFRKDNRILRANVSGGACGFPDTSFHGVTPWQKQFASYDHYVGVMFAGQEKKGIYVDPQILYVASNSYWEDLEVVLPKLPKTMYWEKEVDTWQAEQIITKLEGNTVTVRARSVMVFAARMFS